MKQWFVIPVWNISATSESDTGLLEFIGMDASGSVQPCGVTAVLSLLHDSFSEKAMFAF
jgi:hypothetical protein